MASLAMMPCMYAMNAPFLAANVIIAYKNYNRQRLAEERERPGPEDGRHVFDAHFKFLQCFALNPDFGAVVEAMAALPGFVEAGEYIFQQLELLQKLMQQVHDLVGEGGSRNGRRAERPTPVDTTLAFAAVRQILQILLNCEDGFVTGYRKAYDCLPPQVQHAVLKLRDVQRVLERVVDEKLRTKTQVNGIWATKAEEKLGPSTPVLASGAAADPRAVIARDGELEEFDKKFKEQEASLQKALADFMTQHQQQQRDGATQAALACALVLPDEFKELYRRMRKVLTAELDKRFPLMFTTKNAAQGFQVSTAGYCYNVGQPDGGHMLISGTAEPVMLHGSMRACLVVAHPDSNPEYVTARKSKLNGKPKVELKEHTKLRGKSFKSGSSKGSGGSFNSHSGGSFSLDVDPEDLDDALRWTLHHAYTQDIESGRHPLSDVRYGDAIMIESQEFRSKYLLKVVHKLDLENTGGMRKNRTWVFLKDMK